MLEMTRAAVEGFGQTVVMVTHDARAASYADRVVFLADGHIVEELAAPTMERILDELKRLGE
jgi:putative ABC transport system ATP-binding protein